MPATQPRKKLLGVEYESINVLFNIATGTAFTIQNQGGTPFRICIAASKPSVNTESFRICPAELGSVVSIPAGNPSVWVFGSTVVHAE